MNEFKLSPDVEFKSLYDNAKYDVLKAKESVSKLTEEQLDYVNSLLEEENIQ